MRFLDFALPRSARNDKQKGLGIFRCQGLRRTAATYSPTWWGSTIGDGELNFSVRNGKRWFLTAITAAIYYLREYFKKTSDRFRFNRQLSFYKRKSLGLLVQVC